MPSIQRGTLLAAILATVVAAAPLAAQEADLGPTFRGSGFEIALPAGNPAPAAREGERDGKPATVYLSMSNAWAVSITRYGARSPGDTSLAARRAELHRAASDILQPDGNLLTVGEAREVPHEDRLSLRVPVTFQGLNGVPLLGVVEFSVPLQGEPVVWQVGIVARTRGASIDALKGRVLDSFRLTTVP